MTTAPKLAGFAGALALLFGGGALAGGLIDPSPPSGAAAAAEPHGMAAEAEMGMTPRGLAVAENGLRLVVDGSDFKAHRTAQLRFHIADERGTTVRDFDIEHTKRMHLIVVRRDFHGFQHLHPLEDGNGNWSVPLRLGDPGSYRMFTDFSHDGEKT